jgi:hypothetical protein
MTIAKLLTKLTKLIHTIYESDPTDAGVMTSHLGNGKKYAAVVRFTKPFGKGRQVEFKAKSSSMRDALRSLVRQVSAQTKTTQPISKVANKKRDKR